MSILSVNILAPIQCGNIIVTELGTSGGSSRLGIRKNWRRIQIRLRRKHPISRSTHSVCIYIYIYLCQYKNQKLTIQNSILNEREKERERERERVRVVERRNECGGIESMEGIVGGDRDRTAEETNGF